MNRHSKKKLKRIVKKETPEEKAKHEQEEKERVIKGEQEKQDRLSIYCDIDNRETNFKRVQEFILEKIERLEKSIDLTEEEKQKLTDLAG